MKIQIAILILLVHTYASRNEWHHQKEWCKSPETTADWWKSLMNILMIKETVGAGNNGQAYLIDKIQGMPSELPPTMLIKMMNMKSDALKQALFDNELSAMKAIEPYGVSPKFHKCYAVKDDKEEEHMDYLIMDYINGKPLNDSEFLEHVVAQEVQAMSLWMQLFRAIQALRKEDIVHGDIKLDNVMAHNNFKLLQLIDFGCAGKQGNERMGFSGSPYYISPAKLQGKPVDIMDDIYAGVITILMAHASSPLEDEESDKTFSQENSTKRLFYHEQGGKYIPIGKMCFLAKRTEDCQKKIVENAKTVLEKAGYGKYEKSDGKSYPNFTSLFIDIISFKNPFKDLNDIIKHL